MTLFYMELCGEFYVNRSCFEIFAPLQLYLWLVLTET